MHRGKNSKKRKTKGKKKVSAKKKGGVYQMGGTGELIGTYTAKKQESGAILVEELGDGSGSGSGAVVAGDSFTIIGGYLIAEYENKGDASKGFKKIDEDLKKELDNICNDDTTPVKNATKNGKPTKFSDLLEDDKIAGILTYTHTDGSTFLSLERNNNKDFIAIKIYIGTDTNSGNIQDAHISTKDNERIIYVIKIVDPTFDA